MPGPDGFEAVHKRDVLPKIREQPQSRRCDEVGDAKEDDAEDGHEEEEAEKTQETPREIVDPLAQLEGPQRVADDEEDEQHGDGGVNLAHELAALVEPGVIHLLLGLLLGFDLDGPLALDALGFLMTVAGVRIDLGDAQGEHRHGKQLEGVFEGGAVGDFGQQGILLTRLFVGRGLQSTQRSLDCTTRQQEFALPTNGRSGHRTFEHVLAFAVEDAGTGLQLLAAQEFGQCESFRVRGSRRDGLATGGTTTGWHRTRLARSAASSSSCSSLGLRSLRGGHPLGLGLLLQLLHELGHGHPGLLGVSLELSPHGLDLLGGRFLARLQGDTGRALSRRRHRRRGHSGRRGAHEDVDRDDCASGLCPPNERCKIR